MKKVNVLLLFLVLCWACKEVAPTIPTGPPPSDRKVLMEEFSGGNCTNCVLGKANLDNLKSIYNENLIIVTFHTNLFGQVGQPSPGAKYDFRTEEGTQIMESNGISNGIPSGYVDRQIFEGEPDRPLNKSQWAGFISKAAEELPQMGLNMEVDFDATSRQLTAQLTMVPAKNIAEEVRLHVLITENHIIDSQSTDNGIVEDYSHDHIFRKMLSSINGDIIEESFTSGEVIEKTYTFTLPEEDGWWVAENCNVVAFTSIMDGENRSILQADEVHLSE